MLAELAVRDPGRHQAVLAKSAATVNAKGILWRIEKPGVAPSHLFGTIHMTDERVTRFSAPMQAALAQSKRVALELADMSSEAVQAGMARSAMLLVTPSGNGLDRHLSATEFDAMRLVLQRSGLPEEMNSIIRPWVVHMLLSLSDCERARSASGLKIVDMRIADMARSAGVEVIGLETVDSQLRAISSVPEASQIELLRMSLKLEPRIDDIMETMARMYVAGDMGAAWWLNVALGDEVGTSAQAFDGLADELLVKRNHVMRDRALTLVEQGSAFIAVGALHLPGEEGLVELFRKAGYTLRPIE